MKILIPAITAPYDGIVTEIFYQDGDMVKDGELLVELEQAEQEG